MSAPGWTRLIGSVCMCLALCLFFTACGGNTPDSLAKDSIKYMNDFAEALEKNDEAKAKAAAKGMEDVKKKMDDLKLSEDDKKKMAEKYKDESTKAAARVMSAMMKTTVKDIKMPGM